MCFRNAWLGVGLMSSISVISPAWNPGPFLKEALASVMAQTRHPSSVVVVDDGSDDDVVADTVAEYPTVRLMRQEQSGSSVARNRGADATDSEFLMFLDADDRLRPEALRSLHAALEADPALGMVHGRMFEFVDERYPPPQGVRCSESVVAARLHGSTLLRRSAWECVGPFDERLKMGE